MVCLSSRGPNSEKLLRYASRLAGKLNRNWYAVYAQTPSEGATVIDTRVQRIISDTLTLAKQLGTMVFTYKGEDIADTILRFAKEYCVGHIVIGRSGSKPSLKRSGKNKDIVNNLIKNAKGGHRYRSRYQQREPFTIKPRSLVPEGIPPLPATPEVTTQPLIQTVLSQFLSPSLILMGLPCQKRNCFKDTGNDCNEGLQERRS